ncbi:MAG: cupredoxin domain-containing protein [Candidatus ainarchaeum sp.]|nr:cupredoxin domain-containing protein [Candidatus ainarchaeum sp.]
MKWIMALLVAGILLLGCAQTGGVAQETGGGTGSGQPATGGSGGQVIGVGETTGGTGGSGEAAAGTGGGGGAIIGVEAPTASEGDVTVYIRNFEFVPETVTVRQGQTVYWVNEDNIPHTVRMIGVIDSPYIAKDGEPFWHTFVEAPGTYEYTDGIQASMHGTVIVTR